MSSHIPSGRVFLGMWGATEWQWERERDRETVSHKLKRKPPLPSSPQPYPDPPSLCQASHSGIKTTFCLSTMGVKHFLVSNERRIHWVPVGVCIDFSQPFTPMDPWRFLNKHLSCGTSQVQARHCATITRLDHHNWSSCARKQDLHWKWYSVSIMRGSWWLQMQLNESFSCSYQRVEIGRHLDNRLKEKCLGAKTKNLLPYLEKMVSYTQQCPLQSNLADLELWTIVYCPLLNTGIIAAI